MPRKPSHSSKSKAKRSSHGKPSRSARPRPATDIESNRPREPQRPRGYVEETPDQTPAISDPEAEPLGPEGDPSELGNRPW